MTRKLKTVADFAASGPFTEAQVRWWVFNEHHNGLIEHGAVVRIGRRVYIDEGAFDWWVDSQNQRVPA